MRKADHIVSAKENAGFHKFQLASGYISVTTILFEAESVCAVIEAKGHIELYGAQDDLLAAFDLPEETCGKKVYEEVECGVENGCLILHFPIVEWIDNYPHCDGEHNRWDSKIIGRQTASFDPVLRKVVLS